MKTSKAEKIIRSALGMLILIAVTACDGNNSATDSQSLAQTAVNTETQDTASVHIQETPEGKPLKIKSMYIGMNINDALHALQTSLGSVSGNYRYYDFPKDMVSEETLCVDQTKTCDAVLFWIQRELRSGIGNKVFSENLRSINIALNEKGIPQSEPVLKGRIVADSTGKIIYLNFKDTLIADLFKATNIRLDEFIGRFNDAYAINLERSGLNGPWIYRDPSGALITINGWNIAIDKVLPEKEQRNAFN